MAIKKIRQQFIVLQQFVRGTFNNSKVKDNFLSAIPFWIASLLTGLIAVAYTNLFNFSEALLHQALQWKSWLIFILSPVSFLLGWLIIKRYSRHAGGSGIPQVMAAIELSGQKNEQAISKLLSLRIIVCKILSSMCMVIGGGAIGREGPTIQIAGSVFRIVNKCIPAAWPKLSQKSFILTGAAAGLAAAFNTPLGGIVFAIEELARIHISVFRTALFTAVIIAGLAAQSLLGPYLYLGYPDVRNLHPLIFLGVMAVAVAAGLLAALMCKGILSIMKWRKTLTNTGSIVFVVSIGLIMASIAFFVNDNILGSGKDLMNARLFTENKYETWQTMLARVIGPILSFNTGAAGGIFAPSLAAGASVGAFLSGLFDVIGANANVLILSGMVGFLTGVTRTPFTSAILVLEMTDRHSVIFHLMLAAMVASMASLLIDRHSLYDRLKKNYLQTTEPAGKDNANHQADN